MPYRTPLYFAAHQGKNAEVRRLLKAGFPVNSHFGRKQTALFAAAESKRADAETLRLLIDAGADVNWRDEIGRTPLYNAKDLPTMKALVEAGADATHIAGKGYSCLNAANTIEEAEYLLEMGADPNVVSKWGESCLNRVAATGNLPLARFLLSRGVDPKLTHWTDLNVAVVQGDRDKAAKLLREGADLWAGAWSAWDFAVWFGDVEMASLLHSTGIDVNNEAGMGMPPLVGASYRGKREMVEWLLSVGADLHAHRYWGESALGAAVEIGNVELVRFLLGAGAKLDTGGERSAAIGRAVEIESVRLLVEAGASVNDICEDRHALKTAAQNGDVLFTKQLLDMGATPNLDEFHRSPLMHAVLHDEVEVVELLLIAGADPNYQDVDSETALFDVSSENVARLLLHAGTDKGLTNCVGRDFQGDVIWPEVGKVLGVPAKRCASQGLYDAAWSGDPELVRYFLKLGANPNFSQSWGATPLMKAAAANVLASVEVLLAAKAQPGMRDHNGNTALHFASGEESVRDYDSGWHEPDETDPDLIHRLIQAGIAYNDQNKKKRTPLMSAVLGKKPNAIKALMTISTEHERNAAVRLAETGLTDRAQAIVLAALQS